MNSLSLERLLALKANADHIFSRIEIEALRGRDLSPYAILEERKKINSAVSLYKEAIEKCQSLQDYFDYLIKPKYPLLKLELQMKSNLRKALSLQEDIFRNEKRFGLAEDQNSDDDVENEEDMRKEILQSLRNLGKVTRYLNSSELIQFRKKIDKL